MVLYESNLEFLESGDFDRANIAIIKPSSPNVLGFKSNKMVSRWTWGFSACSSEAFRIVMSQSSSTSEAIRYGGDGVVNSRYEYELEVIL
ncbi:hypothetical protein L1987_76235 [Smallanthus sonchifolius]|uniref:Uncharacterized protein n=1 Tax=Smallanthus sonchifolius TaxID=185202 RepID=A0ACB9A853_9ASTR|nr:hypothetical protein L1987_76235 [Smallanthus sonchifolius]